MAVEDNKKMTLNITESKLRQETTVEDIADVCIYLYKKYGSVKKVVEESGLSYKEVKTLIADREEKG